VAAEIRTKGRPHGTKWSLLAGWSCDDAGFAAPGKSRQFFILREFLSDATFESAEHVADTTAKSSGSDLSWWWVAVVASRVS
jgi:hypothetical protein